MTTAKKTAPKKTPAKKVGETGGVPVVEADVPEPTMRRSPFVGSLIYQRLSAIMADVPAIPKGQRNQAQGYAFRGIDDLYNALHGLFVKHEVVILPEVLETEYVQQLAGRNQSLATDARVRVRYTFAAVDGSTTSIVAQGESRDFADKATNQAMSGALKYGLLQMFLIPLEGIPDADEQSPTIEPESTESIAAKKELVTIAGSTEAAMEFWGKHSELEPASMIDLAHQEYGS